MIRQCLNLIQFFLFGSHWKKYNEITHMQMQNFFHRKNVVDTINFQ